MSATFSLIVEDFEKSLESLAEVVRAQGEKTSAKARVAAVQAATLLLSASFEEFVREMAKEFATQVVRQATNITDLPDSLLETAWKRTLGDVSRNVAEASSKKESYKITATRSRAKVEALWLFMEGDISQNIYDHLIHNENNMRPGEINKLFKISGLSSTCLEVCKQAEIRALFAEGDEGKAHGRLMAKINDFIERRNEIAHSLNSAASQGPDDLLKDLDMFRAFARDLCKTLELHTAAVESKSRGKSEGALNPILRPAKSTFLQGIELLRERGKTMAVGLFKRN